MSRFCAEIQLSVKIPENIVNSLFYPKTHGARRRDGDEPREAHTWPSCGPPLAASRGGLAASGTPSTSPPDYIKPLDIKLKGVRHFSRKSSATPPPPKTPIRRSETPFWHPARTENWRRSSPSSSPTVLILLFTLFTTAVIILSLYRTTNSTKIVEGVVELDSFPCLKVTSN